MTMRQKLIEFARLVADQAERDPEFDRRIRDVLELPEKDRDLRATQTDADKGRPRNRRPPAVLDPIAAAKDGEDQLRARLSDLSLEQLKDIVADYGMDHGKLVMKWKTPERVIDRIVEISLARSQKGDAFRSE